MDGPKLELSSKPFVDAMKPALEALEDLKQAVKLLDGANVKNLKAQLQGLKTQAVSAISGFQEAFVKLPEAMEKSLASATPRVKASAKKMGQEAATAATEGAITTARAARQKLQVEYEKMFSAGGKAQGRDLANLRAQGVQLFPEDIRRLVQYKQELKEIKQQGDLQTNLRAGFASLSSKSATPIDPRTLLGLTPDILVKSAKASASVFQGAFAVEALKGKSATTVDPRVLLGLTPNVMAKSAASSADVFRQAFAVESMRAKSASPVDARTLLGLTPNVMGKSAASSADVFKQAFAVEAMRGKSATTIDPRVLLGLTPNVMAKSAASSADVFKQAFSAEVSKMGAIDKNAAFSALSPAGQLTRATRVAGAMSSGMDEAEALKRYGASAVAASRNLDGLRASVSTLANSKKDLLERSKEVHAAFRGMAGAAGALFLTYGSLIPLTTAFFASTAVKQSFTNFKDLEYQLKFVQALSGDVSTSMGEMTTRLTSMSLEAGKQPVESAKGLRLLAQSGLTAQEALAALPSVMRTATIGELDMADAASTMTGAVYAFGLSMNDIGRVGDIFAKAGAMSNTSVSQISESMKQASTVAGEYKVGIEEVGTALVALAKRNITGSAGGTAFRNLLSDLAAPSGTAKKVADKLGVELFDPVSGKMNDFFGKFIPELRKKLEVLNPASQAYVLNHLANERGAKALSAILGLSDADLQGIKTQLATAEGFTRDAVGRLNDTMQRDFDRLKSTLSSSLVEAGAKGSDGLRSAVQNLTELVGSPEFVGAVANLANLAGGLARALVAVGSAAVNPYVQLTALGAMLPIVRNGLIAVGSSLLGVSGSLSVAAVGATAAGTALAVMSRAFVGFAVISGVVSLLSMLYEKLAEKSAFDDGVASLDRVIKKQREYGKELDETIRKQRIANGQSVAPDSDRVAMVKQRQGLYATMEADQRALDAALANPLMKSGWAALRNKAAGSKSAYERVKGEHLAVYWRDQDNAEKADIAARGAASSAPTPALGTGSNSFTPVDGSSGSAASKAQSEAAKAYRNALNPSENLKASFDNANKALDLAGKESESVLQHRYDMGLLQYEEFETARDALQKKARDARVESLRKESADTDQQVKNLEAAAAAANKKAPGAVTDEQLQSDVKRLQEQKAAAKLELQQLGNDQNAAERATELRRSRGLIDAVKAAESLQVTAQLESDALKASVDERIRMLGLSNEETVRAEAAMSVREKFLKQARDLEAEIAKYRGTNPELADNARAKLAELKGQGVEGLAGKAGDDAVREAKAKAVDSTARDLKSGIADAIIEGGTTGAEALHNTLRDVFLKRPIKLMLEAVFDPLAQAASGFLMNMLGLNFMGARAGGGPVSAGNRYLVGENGPEVLELGQSGKVYNAAESRQMMTQRPQQSGGGINVTLSPQIHVDARSDQGQVAQLVQKGIQISQKQMMEELRQLGVIG